MSSLSERLLKSSKIKESSFIKDSKVFGKKDAIVTDIPILNVALSGSFTGGLLPGLFTLAGPSKHFKSTFALIMAAAFQKKHKDGIILFYDSEFGSPEDYFLGAGIDMDRVIHTPVMNVEDMKFDIMSRLESIEKDDNVFILFDSLGNLASKKEVEDALKESGAADMSRAKQIKSLFRMVTPYLAMKKIYMIAINHTYKTQEMYAKDVVSGGTGPMYSSNDVWIIGRQQEKDGKEVTGYDFIINVEKSRTVREKSKIPISVRFEGGINRWSGLFDLAVEMGYIDNPKKGWYNRIDPETGEVSETSERKAAIENDGAFWKKLILNAGFGEAIKKRYKLEANLFSEQTEEVIDNDETE